MQRGRIDRLDNMYGLCMVGALLETVFFFSSRRRHTRLQGDWSSDVCSSDLIPLRDTEPAFFANVGQLDTRILNGKTSLSHRLTRLAFRQRGTTLAHGDAPVGQQIGRASCRERSVDLGGRRIIKKKKEK